VGRGGHALSAALRIEDDPRGFRTILIDRPATRNSIDRAVADGLREAIVGAPEASVVIGSTDPRAFSAGADLDLDDAERASVSDSLYALYQEMRASPRIIIAALSGSAVGGGAQLMIASDIRIAAADLVVRFMGPGHGLAVGAWGLPSLIGRGRALDLCLSMRPVLADEALAMGLIDRLAEDPLPEAIDYAAHVARLDSGAVRTLKRVVGLSVADGALAEERAHNATWDGSIPRGE